MRKTCTEEARKMQFLWPNLPVFNPGDQKGRKQRSDVLEHGAFRLRFGGLPRCSQEAVGLHGVKRLQCPVFPSSPPFPNTQHVSDGQIHSLESAS